MPNASKEKSREYRANYAKKHPDRVAANAEKQKHRKLQLYKDDPDYREKVKAAARNRHAANREENNAKRRNKTEEQRAKERAYNRSRKRRRAVRDALFLKKYGITHDQYDAMAAAQGGVCAICGGTKAIDKWKSGLRNLQVDHCHDTGKVRGLLCFSCNTALGHFGDDLALVQKALVYLERHTNLSS